MRALVGLAGGLVLVGSGAAAEFEIELSGFMERYIAFGARPDGRGMEFRADARAEVDPGDIALSSTPKFSLDNGITVRSDFSFGAPAVDQDATDDGDWDYFIPSLDAFGSGIEGLQDRVEANLPAPAPQVTASTEIDVGALDGGRGVVTDFSTSLSSS